MFKGKVVIYKNEDGKEKRIEKEFDNQQDYEQFVQENNEELSWFRNPWEAMRGMHSFINDVIDRRFGLGFSEWEEDDEDYVEIPELVDMDKYENALQTLEDKKLLEQEEEEERKIKIEQYRADIEKLDGYEKELKKHKETNKDLLKELENDKRKLQDEIKRLEKK